MPDDLETTMATIILTGLFALAACILIEQYLRDREIL